MLISLARVFKIAHAQRVRAVTAANEKHDSGLTLMTDSLMRLHRAMPKKKRAMISQRPNQLSVVNEARCQPLSHMKKLGGALAEGAWVGTRTARPKTPRAQLLALFAAARVALGPQQRRNMAVHLPCAGTEVD